MAKISGFLLINKPKNISSFNCVKTIRELLPYKVKVGHAGTLDKEASGLIILGISREATKRIGSILNLDKHYVVKAKLGELTSTLDYSGNILSYSNVSRIAKKDIVNAINNIGTEYKQIPPIYSALKHNGQSLYKLARSDKTLYLENIVKLKARTIKLHRLELIDFTNPYFSFNAHVSKGTYVRSLANDIAKMANSQATTYELCRTQIGPMKLEDAISIEDINSLEDIMSNIMQEIDFLASTAPI